MVKVIINAETMRAIASKVAATSELRGGRELEDGRWEIELDPEAAMALARRFPGLTIDDAILALCGGKQ